MNAEHYDLVIIGSGSGNSVPQADHADLRVAVVEGGVCGGTCLNNGCIPTKMFVVAAESAMAPRQAARLGVDLPERVVSYHEHNEATKTAELLESVGVSERGLDQLAHKGFHTLGLQTYLTAGPKETRAWTIRKGWTAPQAAGVIHTDFERGFIKAEVVSFDDLDAAGSMVKAKEAGRVRMEGKDYVMKDGDVVEFRTGLTSGSKK